jgi:hypothetical protein
MSIQRRGALTTSRPVSLLARIMSTLKAGFKLHPFIISQQMVEGHSFCSNFISLCRCSMPWFLSRSTTVISTTTRLRQTCVRTNTARSKISFRFKSLTAANRILNCSLSALNLIIKLQVCMSVSVFSFIVLLLSHQIHLFHLMINF